MNVPGVINTIYLDNIQLKISNIVGGISKAQAEVDACDLCSELANLKNVISEGISAELTKFNTLVEDYFKDQLAEITKTLGVLGALMSPPTDIGSVVTWIGNFISSNFTTPYNNMIALQAQMLIKQAEIVAQLGETLSSLSSLQSSIMSKISSLNCDII